MKKFGLALAMALALGVVPAQNAFPVSISDTLQDDESYFQITTVGIDHTVSALQGETWKQMPNGVRETVSTVICERFGSKPCNSSGKNYLRGNLIAPICQSAKINCIEQIYGYVDGKKVQGEFLGYTAPNLVAADLNRGLFNEGRSSSRWKIPGVLHGGGTDTYMATVNYAVEFSQGRYSIVNFKTALEPYTEAPKKGLITNTVEESDDVNGEPWVSYANHGCLWGFDGICGTRSEFLPGQRLGLKLRFQNGISNWFQGRLNSPEISISKYGSNAQAIDVAGEAIKVPEFRINFKEADVKGALATFMKKYGYSYWARGGALNSPDTEAAITMVNSLRSVVKEQASKSGTHWFIANLPSKNNDCLDSQGQVLGIVTTNSMAYQPGPPIFKSGYLQYSVAGLHFEPDGATPQVGTYDLVMRSSVARCLFNIPNVPISGSVSVVNENGIKSTATTVVSEKNGWIKLRAAGFTFSKKTIKAKITKKNR